MVNYLKLETKEHTETVCFLYLYDTYKMRELISHPFLVSYEMFLDLVLIFFTRRGYAVVNGEPGNILNKACTNLCLMSSLTNLQLVLVKHIF